MKCTMFSAMLRGPRPRQEDCILDGVRVYQADWLEEKREISTERILLAVCDGMGGHAGGDKASRFVCDALAQKCHDEPLSPGTIGDALGRIQVSAQAQLQAGSGTTVAGLFLGNDRVVAFNAGDSRVYRITHQGIEYISHDHSLVQGLVDQSFIQQDIAPLHPLKSLIDFGIGPAFADTWQEYSVHIHEEPLVQGTCYLLCSDGLSDLMTDRALFEHLIPAPLEKGAALPDLIQAEGAIDNTSFILAEIG